MVGWPHLIDLGWYWFFLSVGRTDPSGSAYWFVSICSISLFSTGNLKIIINELTAIEVNVHHYYFTTAPKSEKRRPASGVDT